MKKLVLVFAILAFVFAGLTSCKKCSTCTAKKSNVPDVTGAKTCGKAKDIDNYKDAFKKVYEAAGYEVTCD